MRSPPPRSEQIKEFWEKRVPIPGKECFTGKNLCDEYANFEPSEEIYKIGTDVNSVTTNQGIPVGGLVTGKDIEVHGTYRITVAVQFKNCNFKMHAGSKIIFETSTATYLRFYFCNFFSCEEMWEGIRVENSASANQFIFSGCHIEDAFKALTVKETGTVAILNTYFVNNFISITNLKQDGSVISGTIRGNTFTETAELRPLLPKFIAEILANSLRDCGIYLVNTRAFIGSPGLASYINLFTCINNGIYAIDCEILSRNNHFDYMGQGDSPGAGIESIGGTLTVKDKCKFTDISFLAVTTTGANLTAYNNDFLGDMFFAIESKENDNGEEIDIHHNRMNLTGPNCYIGINVDRSNGMGDLLVSYTMVNDNFITASLPTTNTYTFSGIYVGSADNATDEVQILRDTVRINGSTPSANGITVYLGFTGDNIRIEHNDIKYANTTNPFGFSHGIEINGAHPFGGINHKVRNNLVEGTTGNFPAFCGIHTSQGNNVEYCYNTMNDVFNGMHFGLNNAVEIRENRLNRHQKGLWISTSDPINFPTFIGVQTRRANEWLGAFGDYIQFTAHCDNCTNTAQSRFIIETNTQPRFPFPALLNPPISGSASDWFRTVAGDLDLCNHDTIKLGKEGSFEEMVKEGTSGLPASMEWDWKRQLILKQSFYPDAEISDLEQMFYEGLVGSSAGAYAEIMKRVIEAQKMTPEQYQTIRGYRSVIQQKMKEWEELSIAYASDDPENPSQEYTDAVEALFPALTAAAQNEQDWELAREAELRTLLLEIREANDALAVTEGAGWMEAQKLLNKVTLNHLLKESVSETDYAALLEIAAGDAASVGMAKIEVLKWLYPWDAAPYEQASDHSEGMERSRPVVSTLTDGNIFQATPNPSTGIVQLSLPKDLKNARLQVLNASGRVVLERHLSSDISLSLDLSNQPTGLYSIVLRDIEKGTQRAVKVAIQR